MSKSKVILFLFSLLLLMAAYFYYKQQQNVSLPTQSAQSIATLDYLLKQVEARRAGAIEWNQAKTAQPLYDADAIKTAAQSAAVISYSPLDSIRLEENSLMVIHARDQQDQNADANLEIIAGGVIGTAGQMRLQINTPSSQTTLEPATDAKEASRIIVRVGADQSSIISVIHGVAVTRHRGKKIELHGGEAVRLTKSEAAAVSKLAAAPQILSPLPNAILQLPSLTEQLSVEFVVASKATQHHLQIARDPQFLQLLGSHYFAGERLLLAALPAGDYYWNIAVIESRGEHGNFSPVQHFKISAAIPPAVVPTMPQPTAKPPVAAPKALSQSKTTMKLVRINDQNGFSEFAHTGQPPQVQWQWQRQTQAVMYQLEVFRKSDLTKPLFQSEKVRTNEVKVVLDALTPGSYSWRVRYIDYRGKIIGHGDWQELRVAAGK